MEVLGGDLHAERVWDGTSDECPDMQARQTQPLRTPRAVEDWELRCTTKPACESWRVTVMKSTLTAGLTRVGTRGLLWRTNTDCLEQNIKRYQISTVTWRQRL